ncbi:baseplate J/gp47 family protein [Bacillota bacterium Meth-B3]
MNELIFFDGDAQTMIDEAIGIFDSVLGETTGEADERRLVLMAVMQVLIAVGARVNLAGLRNLVDHADGAFLDAIGKTAFTKRLSARPATTTIRFSLSVIRAQNTVIPSGTRVTPDGELFFATDETIVITAGSMTGDSAATCVEDGVIGNGYAIGAISTLVDPIAYVASASNINASAGGSEAESDVSYRERIIMAPVSYSTAGSSMAYEYWARAAHADIIDVRAVSPAAGEMTVVVLVGGGTPSQQVLSAVTNAVSSSEHRPVTDRVTVTGPEMVPYNVELKYYAPAATLSVVRGAIEGPGGVLDQYYAWQGGALGRAINPDKLLALLVGAGAVKVEITSPVYTALTANQAATFGTAEITCEALTEV